jgi:hypothetical protein
MAATRREHRDRERIQRAAAAIRAETGSALEACLAQVGAAFDQAAAVNSFKIRVERLLRLGPGHPALRARYGARAALLDGRDLDGAVAAVERWWREERKAAQLARALGYGNALALDVLRELRLILRLLRFKRMAADYRNAVAMLCDRPAAIAAE